MLSDVSPATAPPSLPVGTITFLFTDIEGSTRLWEAHHDAMARALAHHDAVIRKAIEAHRGVVVKTAGDGFCAAFQDPLDALAASLTAQRALHAERWPEDISLRVRMALHTGTAELRDRDYFGPNLNRVARLLAIGHGGQTLSSETTSDLCRDLLPTGVSLRRLGEHSLKDLSRREAVFQVCHPSLPDAFPPLRSASSSAAADTPSIAVLPFVNMSADPDTEYFAEGLSEQLLNVLAKIRGLRVASRTSAFSFKGGNADIPTIAQKLGVATVLEGSVRKRGQRVRITAQLIRAGDDSHLWSETYDRQLDDIFAVEDDIVQSVVKELRAALLGEPAPTGAATAVVAEVAVASKGRGFNSEAYVCYLQGRFFIDRWARDDEAKGVRYLRTAVERDSGYALAWAVLSRAYANEAANGWVPLSEGFGRARDAALRALALEPDLAEGHAALGRVRMMYDWDWPGAEASLNRALELAPGDADVLRAMAILAGCLCRLDEAIAFVRRAITLDPLSVPAYRALGRWCLYAGRIDDADAAVQKALELNDQGGYAHYLHGLVELVRGRLDQARASMELETTLALRLQGRALVHHARGEPALSDAALGELTAHHGSTEAVQIAQAHAYRGEAGLAFDWLERAFVQRDPGLVDSQCNPLLAGLHDDPRWHPFLVRIGFARASRPGRA